MKLNVLTLDKDQKTKISKYIEDKQTTRNVNIFYQVAKVYKLTNLAEVSFSFVERCFPIVVESKNFLELEFNIVAKILASSELSIHSELEVFNAANGWLGYNIGERREFAKNILLKVRLSLLSDHALTHVLNNTSSSTCIDDCRAMIKNALDEKEVFIGSNASVHTSYRFCHQDKFSMLYCGGFENNKVGNKVLQVDGSNLKTVKVLPTMMQKRRFSEAVCLKGDVYVFGGFGDNNKWITAVEHYSPNTNAWNKVADMIDNRRDYCVCGLMDNVFIIGGYDSNSCLQFDTKKYEWKEVARMNEARSVAACTVFEGNVIVAGGVAGGINNQDTLRSVESYDVIADEWSPMANMIREKSHYRLLVAKSNLYAIGSGYEGFEMYDKICKKFVDLKLPKESYITLFAATSIGSKIIVFLEESAIACYDVDDGKWTEETCDVAIFQFSCVNVPWLQ